jgi:hypothetical protein
VKREIEEVQGGTYRQLRNELVIRVSADFMRTDDSSDVRVARSFAR